MDEVQRAFYQVRFREAFLEKKGTEFQDWFVKLASHALGSDFEAVRPYGSKPDGIFTHLQHYAGAGGEPRQQNAALAVLSYFFERCDIFEDPEYGE